MRLGKFLRAGFTGLEVVAIFALITGLVAGTKLVSQRQLTSTSASLCCNGGTCANGQSYGDDPTTPHSSCPARTAQFCADKGGPGTGGAQCSTTTAPAPNNSTQCDNANSLYCREDGKAWWCNGSRQWEAGEGKSCSNKCSPTTSEASCSDSANYKDIGSSCGNAGRCVANGSSNGFTSCRCDTSTTAPPPSVPSNLPSCSAPNTLLCVNGLSSWCNASSKLEVGTKTCGANTCHPTASGSGCGNSNNYLSVGSACNNGGKCQTTGSLNGFATCGCVVPPAPPPAPVTCTGNGGVYCPKATQVCTGSNSSKYDTATLYCCTGPATCKAKPPTAPQQICTPGAKVSCEANGQVKSCNADGSGYVYDSCNNLGCNTSTKSCNVCQPNKKECTSYNNINGGSMTCKADGSGWLEQPCSIGCNPTSKSCYTTCKPGTSACVDGNSKVCNANGDGYTLSATCGANGCNSATAKCNVCEANKTSCSSDQKVLTTCNSSGSGQTTQTCAGKCLFVQSENKYACGEDVVADDSAPRCIEGVPGQVCTSFNPVTNQCQTWTACRTNDGFVCVGPNGSATCGIPTAGNNFVSGGTKVDADLAPSTTTSTTTTTTSVSESIPVSAPDLVPNSATDLVPFVAASPTPNFAQSAAVVVEQTRVTVAGTIRSIIQIFSDLFNFR